VKILDKSWQDWIQRNIARGCLHDDMLGVMVKAGILEQTARFNLANFANGSDSTVAPTVSNLAGYQQDASYLFQHENTIVTRDGQAMQVAFRLDSPDIAVLDNFMTHAECDALCAQSESTLSKSKVIDDKTGASIAHDARSSQGTYFSLGQTPLVQTIEARVSEITNTPVVNGEGIQILNYVDGGEYRPHFDYFPDNEGGRVHTAKGGQRIITVIMYLNNVTAGGATIFPNINLNIYPKKGSALYFSYFNSKGQVDPATLHGGAPVLEGEKWIATKWIREREYR
jgi:prolyl 4-hydroxylase